MPIGCADTITKAEYHKLVLEENANDSSFCQKQISKLFCAIDTGLVNCEEEVRYACEKAVYDMKDKGVIVPASERIDYKLLLEGIEVKELGE